ncbi:MAG: bacteriohemerythrin [Alphaproteobacteria bacterium]|nr:bacteriohemerythrin [Alphaproteobacteria bacterium]
MAAMEWQDSFSVGNEKMDDQHKGLVDLVNLLDDEDMTGIALERLKSYVQEHFRDEERLLQAAGYPDLDEQKIQHKEFEDWLAQTHQSYVTGSGSKTLRQDVQEYLKSWLTEHILESDKAYMSWLK